MSLLLKRTGVIHQTGHTPHRTGPCCAFDAFYRIAFMLFLRNADNSGGNGGHYFAGNSSFYGRRRSRGSRNSCRHWRLGRRLFRSFRGLGLSGFILRLADDSSVDFDDSGQQNQYGETTTRPVTRTTRAVSMFSITFTLYYKIFTFPALRLKIAKFPDFNYCAIIARFCLFFNRIWTKKSPSCENFNKLSLFHKENVKKK